MRSIRAFECKINFDERGNASHSDALSHSVDPSVSFFPLLRHIPGEQRRIHLGFGSSPPSWCAPSVLYFLVPQVLLISCFKRLKLGKLGKCCLSLEEVPVEVGRIRLVHAFRRSLGSGNSCLLWTGPQRWLHIRLRATPKTHNRPQSMRDSNNSCPASPLFPRGQAKKAIKLMQSGVTRL